MNWNIEIPVVQQFWNVFENLLINVVDEIVPLNVFEGNIIKNNTPRAIKNKINKKTDYLSL